MLIEQDDTPIAAMEIAALRDCINELNARSDTLGGIVFPALDDDRNVLVVFAGNLERFAMLSVARRARCKVLYLQDTVSWWYGGSPLLPDLRTLTDGVVRGEIGPAIPTFFGQSSGAYASLYAGSMFERAQILACAPQTFADRLFKSAMVLSRFIHCNTTPDDLIDLAAHWGSVAPAERLAAIVMSVSESGNPVDSHFWMDYAHVMRMTAIPEIRIFMRASHRHALVHRNAEAFSGILAGMLELSGAPMPQRLEFLANRMNALDQAELDRG